MMTCSSCISLVDLKVSLVHYKVNLTYNFVLRNIAANPTPPSVTNRNAIANPLPPPPPSALCN